MSDTTKLLRMLVSNSTTPSESGRCIVVDLNLLESEGDPLFLLVRTRLRPPSQVLSFACLTLVCSALFACWNFGRLDAFELLLPLDTYVCRKRQTTEANAKKKDECAGPHA
ncbi:uncharacterized protein BO87DRAFT_374848 [Aspergillus neoniger CBS 115656]|uniref:Uncharacterized protein n=1 Tax=Aspergillus neoniger (strain CBS 115656) TaxID=1448310 RepID=A0A318YPD0_ASPNB|nr:hypothetical protein BO87DRAFT_374848 [Aspergillus neoniger CBS 115656]PYH36501.1 hypothetical protein BO87DRAFT_374848 [Aspergillus neoniger CBS 115656]